MKEIYFLCLIKGQDQMFMSNVWLLFLSKSQIKVILQVTGWAY